MLTTSSLSFHLLVDLWVVSILGCNCSFIQIYAQVWDCWIKISIAF